MAIFTDGNDFQNSDKSKVGAQVLKHKFRERATSESRYHSLRLHSFYMHSASLTWLVKMYLQSKRSETSFWPILHSPPLLPIKSLDRVQHRICIGIVIYHVL